MKQNSLWIIIGLIVIVVLLLFAPFIFYRGGWMHNGYGMMGSGWMFLGWLIPAGILVLVIAGGVWLGNSLSNRGNIPPDTPGLSCSNCSKPVAADWKTCPYCSISLE